MIILQNQDARTPRDWQYLCRCRDAVSHRRDERHVLWVGVNQPRSRISSALVLFGGERVIDQPGAALARHSLSASIERRKRQRAI